MSTRTRDFIQKICYKRTASVDMTRHGFLRDSKLYHVNLLLRPLREKLHNICGKTEDMHKQGNSRKSSPLRKFELNRPKARNLTESRRNKLKNSYTSKRRKKIPTSELK